MDALLHRNRPFAMPRSTTSPPPAPKNRSAVHSEEHARQFAWVDWLLARTGRTDASLAKDAGLNVNYIYRKRKDGTVFGATQIRMLVEHYGLPGPDTYQVPGASGIADEGAPFDTRGTSVAIPSIVRFLAQLAKDHPNATPWELRTRALEQAGYQPGDIVVVDPSVPHRAGDAVAAQVHDPRSGAMETVFRIFEAPYLMSASNDPSLRKPMLVDNDRVIVIGPITESIRARRR
ncbi:hypothetical protein JQ633_12405 [Bradyrhizobium tropiciagri]|uniref:hypothetical protein n=1 Tax=Bradyrhizobium tropiciagri TaxID=312253 RepID=UPI001BA96611|nr:hypothetical protein [Bradyrhizobium tropiciagri]MBR0871165.1 hypothetical protein [Bradyrhizobium tropiciagri]